MEKKQRIDIVFISTSQVADLTEIFEKLSSSRTKI